MSVTTVVEKNKMNKFGQVRDRGGSFPGKDRRSDEGDIGAKSCRRRSEPFGHQGEEWSRQREEQGGQRP